MKILISSMIHGSIHRMKCSRLIQENVERSDFTDKEDFESDRELN